MEDGNVHLTRIRLGLSHLRAHLYHYNLIADPVCQFCNIEPETTAHYILRCPTFHAARTNYLLGLTVNLDADFLRNLDDNKKINLFLHGNDALDDMTNTILFEMALNFIINKKRFNLRIVQ